MTTPDEVLRAMAEAANQAEFIMCDAATCNGMCEAPEVHFAPAIQRALAAADQAGWRLVPVEADEAMLQAAGATPNGVSPRGGIDRLGRMLPKYWAAMLNAAPKVTP